MKLLQAAAKAAGDVGQAYAQSLINERILEKREQRLAQRDERDFEQRKELAQMTNQQAMDRWKTEREATAGDVTGYEEVPGMGLVPVTRQGIGDPVPGTREAMEQKESMLSKSKEVAHLRKLEEEVYGSDMLPEEREARLEEIQMRKRLLSAETPEERQALKQEIQDVQLQQEVAPGVAQAKERGMTMEAYQDALRQNGRPDAAEAVPRVWGERSQEGQEGETARRTPTVDPESEEFRRAPLEVRKQSAEQRLEEQQKRETEEQERTDTSNFLKAIVADMKGEIQPYHMGQVVENYDFIAENLSLFNSKDVRRFNAALKALNDERYGGATVYEPFSKGE